MGSAGAGTALIFTGMKEYSLRRMLHAERLANRRAVGVNRTDNAFSNLSPQCNTAGMRPVGAFHTAQEGGDVLGERFWNHAALGRVGFRPIEGDTVMGTARAARKTGIRDQAAGDRGERGSGVRR